MIERRHVERQSEFSAKPQGFLSEIPDINERDNPPLSKDDAYGLMRRFGIGMPELTRLSLFVYGIEPGAHPVTGRQDGVIAGVDTYVSRNRSRVGSVAANVGGIDLDAGRLAVFIGRQGRYAVYLEGR